MRWFAFGVVMLLLSACSSEEKVYTVDELVDDEALLAKIVAECRNNPSELRDTANCRNAEAADGKLRLERMRKSLGG
ncbi:EexN family lipoprotein [Rhizobium pusense]|uniref:EexN family lipoprotein n=1 Tax=Agrobacterium TaxID=357 RepID=UPI000D19B989|nr:MULTISPECIES: EexN family lipoprotein [Agrobacterium]MCD4662656.1 EexN family lipoprotein [Agrobacterium sp.]MDH0910572.1 EexN family lipoprotein [Agrobacterium pusense]MDH1098476.1 EexN family lipoprotein [Agrobacterium pusense]MDH1114752.1 EexN family lipoprotein [Agrobacterium pusense]MDH2197002.1 EexN family lipoprotein [Agrobacterium pusense]